MIMRVYRCKVVAGKEAEFRELAYANGHAWLRTQPGLIAFYAGKSQDDRCMVQIWENQAALQSAFGEGWQQPRQMPEELRRLVVTEHVEHYEIADEFRTEL